MHYCILPESVVSNHPNLHNSPRKPSPDTPNFCISIFGIALPLHHICVLTDFHRPLQCLPFVGVGLSPLRTYLGRLHRHFATLACCMPMKVGNTDLRKNTRTIQ